ncbi:hypothetical protein WR25_03413 [Diploscapter pachys]|uniref:Decapping nuclease n=1 Tax=Diploscapter pachys TaxID=2018661 RepID=A0A2A2LTK8_9BILA|nr:hypothetical protein WR25_03413 [Diploscapter pachys]
MLSKLFEVLEAVKKLLDQDGKTCTVIRSDMGPQSKLTKEEKLAKKGRCTWIVAQFDISINQQSVVLLGNVDFVSFRGVLSRIAQSPCTPFEWRFLAIRKYDVIFLLEIPTESKNNNKSGEAEGLQWYRGFKFEQMITCAKDGTPSNPTDPVNRNEEFAAVYRTELGNSSGKKLSLYYAAEIDALDRNDNILEMKVMKGAIDDEKFLKSAARRHYVQGALAMVKKIHFGQRDDNGKIASITEATLDSLAKRSKMNPKACWAVLHSVLNQVKEILVNDGDTCRVVRSSDQKMNYSTLFIVCLVYAIINISLGNEYIFIKACKTFITDVEKAGGKVVRSVKEFYPALIPHEYQDKVNTIAISIQTITNYLQDVTDVEGNQPIDLFQNLSL